MRVGVLSDTHGCIDRTLQAVRLWESLHIAMVIHCGDVGSPDVLDRLGRWPVHFVLGNVDPAAISREAMAVEGRTCHGRFGSLELEGKRIAFLHGDDTKRLRQTIHSGKWDLVCCGHTHVAEIKTVNQTLVVNPGAVQRSSRPSVAIVDLPRLQATPISL